MTFREIFTRFVQHGRLAVQQGQGVVRKGGKKVYSQKAGKSESVRQEYDSKEIRSSSLGRPAESKLLWRFMNGSGKSNKTSALRTWASDLRRKAASQFTPGAAGRVAFAFAGVSFGARQYGLYETDPLDSICEEIQHCFPAYGQKVPWSESQDDYAIAERLEDFEFGRLIAKGCNAAVYEARLKDEDIEILAQSGNNSGTSLIGLNQITNMTPELVQNENLRTAQEPVPLQFVDNYFTMENSDDGLEDSFEVLSGETSGNMSEMSSLKSLSAYFEDFDQRQQEIMFDNKSDYNLAVKVMFNYDAESNAPAVLQAMEKEAIPAQRADSFGDMSVWDNGNHVKKKRKLPPHSNIVEMYCVFADYMPCLADARVQYPDALPSRINPSGFGRNMTMFLVMKRYTMTLRSYLQSEAPTIETCTVLLAQLLEGVIHLGKHGVAHRDLKTDNILLDFSQGADYPQLVITDFGCCLADDTCGWKIPFNSPEVTKGGNAALMAPEISCAIPSPSSYLDYSHSDLWAVGAIAYELFGLGNPFYRSAEGIKLDSRTYKEDDLPDLPHEVPYFVKQVVASMLQRDPLKRPSPSVAANLLYLGLWAPDSWRNINVKLSRAHIMSWILNLVVDAKFRVSQNPSQTKLKEMFLSRVKLHEVVISAELLRLMT